MAPVQPAPLPTVRLTITTSLKSQGTVNLSNNGTLVAGINSFVDFSGGSLIAGLDATVTGLTGSLINFPQGYNPLTAIGHFSTAGLVHIDGDPLTIPASGGVHGSGIVKGGIDNFGLVSPGHSPGAIEIVGDFTQEPAAVLQIELAGNTGDQFDLLIVTGTANLGGLLSVNLLDGYLPSASDQFTFLTSTSLTGVFSNAGTGIDVPGGHFAVQYSAGGVTLSNFVATPEPSSLALLCTSALWLRRHRRND